MTSQAAESMSAVTPAPSAEAVVRPLVHLLRCWSGNGNPPAANGAPPVSWLEGLGEPLLTGLVQGFELYRRDQWLQYALAPGTEWGRWTGGELERPAYEVAVPTSPNNTRLRLRRDTPFTPPDVLDFLTALAAAEEAGRLHDRKAAVLRGAVLDILHQAAPGNAQLAQLHQRHRGEQIRAGALRRVAMLDQPPPPRLQECLERLFTPGEEVEGCLTRRYRSRLFRQLAELAPPLIARETFAAAAALALPPEDPALALREVCRRLGELGRFACCVGPVLAGPAAGAHRQWLRLLLTNFERLGGLACCLLGEAPPRPEPPPAPAEDSPAEPEPPREPSPEEAALAELATSHPAAEQFLAIVTRSEELLPTVRGWHEAEEAVTGLQYPGNRFRQKLVRAAQAAPEEQGRQIADAARQLADELVNKIRRLDALLPGVGSSPPPFRGPAHLAAPAREQLAQKLRALRDRVFQMMRAHGGYDEYVLAVGDSVRKHGPVLDDVTYVSGPRLRPDEIVHILEPGYVRRREDGKQELIRSPKVLVAR